MKLVRTSDGSLAPHPDIRADAARMKHKLYGGRIQCPTCGFKAYRYTSTDNCIMCQRFKIDLIRYYAETDGMHGKLPSRMPTTVGDDAAFVKDAWDISRDVKAGRYTLGGEPCKKHGHIPLYDPRAVGHCLQCEQNGTPREAALMNGDEVYLTTGKCGGCNRVTLRNTIDRSCTECGYTPVRGANNGVPNPNAVKVSVMHKDTSDKRETETTVFMRENPDMVISRDEAETLGLVVYRTGEPCKHGHTGWRYLSTGNCIDCRKS